MEENNEPLPVYSEVMTPERALSSFFLLVFTANPNKDNVKVIVDGGDVKFSIKRDRFLNLIENYMGKAMRNACEPCIKEYGTSYLINRMDGTLNKLYNSASRTKLSPSAGFKYAREQADGDDFYKSSKEYQKALQQMLDSDMSKGKDTHFSASKASGFVDLTNVQQG